MDRRQKKTRKAIFKAFEELMAKEHYSQVTVAEIIENADIGRSTFYAHFETKDDLLESMCEEMFAHVFTGVDERCDTHQGLSTETIEGKLAHLLFHLRDSYGGLCKKLIAEGEPHFVNRFRTHLAELLDTELASTSDSIPPTLLKDIRLSAFCQTVTWWYGEGNDADPRDLASWFIEAVE